MAPPKAANKEEVFIREGEIFMIEMAIRTEFSKIYSVPNFKFLIYG